MRQQKSMRRRNGRLVLLIIACLVAPISGFTIAIACPISVATATLRWVENHVIGLKLCPWATAESSRGFRLLTAHDADEAIKIVAKEAAGLSSRAREQPRATHTTLVVVDDPELDDIRTFAVFCRRSQKRIRRSAEEGVTLLAFHPRRIDHGPGLTSDPNDAAHYSVRAPFPVVQVLRETDLASARQHWRETRAAAAAVAGEEPPPPGALGLLLDNQRRLRAMGCDALKELMDACVTASVGEDADEVVVAGLGRADAAGSDGGQT